MDEMNLPVYKCHKEVRASKIMSIGMSDNFNYVLKLRGVRDPVSVSVNWLYKHEPEVGGYFVNYKDGYRSYSSKEAFEDGHTLVEGREQIMSNKYKHGDIVPSNVLCKRLDQLSDAVTKGRDSINREFYMSVPAQLDNDADLVISEASRRIIELEKKLLHLIRDAKNCCHKEKGGE